MIRMILHGCSGHMGKVVTDIVSGRDDISIVAGVDRAQSDRPYPIYDSLDACAQEADVIVDFSNRAAVDGLLEQAAAKSLPIVLCTTGLSEEQIAAVSETAKKIPILRSANMSLGVNALYKIVALATQILGESGFDIEIVEKHHNRKMDAPSGTAIAIANVINETLGGGHDYNQGRGPQSGKRQPGEIGIQAVRGGTIVGEHEVLFCGLDEVIEIRHTAYSRAIFGKGAVEAAVFLAGKEPGLYQMSDVIG